MRYRCVCGFEYCTYDGTPTYCGGMGCVEYHGLVHNTWEKQQKNNLPAPLEDRIYKDSSSVFEKSPKWCPSCEERVNVTHHICKGEAKAKDTIDVMIDIFKKDQK